MRKKTIRYIELTQGGCGLTTDSKATILRYEGRFNVKLIRNATQKDVDWVRGMGGYVPDGSIARSAS